MKQLLLFLALFLGLNTSAQIWFDVGLKGGPGTSFLINSEIFDDSKLSHKFTFSYFVGGKVGVHFDENNAVTLNITSTKIAQKLQNTHDNFNFNERNINAQSIDFALFYRRVKESSYFEIGPQFSLLTNQSVQDDAVEISISDNWADNFIGATIGFGGFVMGGDRFSVIAGFQATYGFTDLFSGVYDPGLPIASQYNDASTMPFAAMLNIEFNYSLGYIVSSSCGKRTSFISF